MTTRYALGSCLAFAATVAIAPAPTHAQESNRLPPTLSTTYTLPDPAAEAAKPKSPRQDYEADSRETMAVAFKAADGSLLASVAVNRITCRAVSGTGPDAAKSGVEWLGTQMGVKAIDRAGRAVALYTRRDGLPGDYVEAIAVEGQESVARVYCLVRLDSPEKLALCAMEARGSKAGRWYVLATVDSKVRHPDNWSNQPQSKIDNSWFPRWGISHLAVLRDGSVLVAPSAVDWHSDALLYRWDTRSHALTPLPWDAGMRADSDVIGITDLYIDGDQTAYLATTEGILSFNAPDTAPSYRRLLPDKRIDAILAQPSRGDSGTVLYVAFRDRRQVKDDPNAWQQPQFPDQVAAIHLKTSTVEMLPERKIPLESTNYDNGGILSVESVTRALDGSIWLSAVARSRYESNWTQHPGGFSRFDPQTHLWTEMGLNGLALGQNADYQRQNLPAGAEIVPDDASFALAFSRIIGNSALSGDRNPNTNFNLLNPHLWASRRESIWLSPADVSLEDESNRYAASAFEAPDMPDHRWSANGQDLIDSVKPIVNNNPAIAAPPPTPEERYTMRGGTHYVSPRMVMTVPSSAGSNSIVIQCHSGIFQLTENAATGTRVWKRFGILHETDDQSDRSFQPWSAQIARIGPDQRLYEASQNAHFLRRYDAAVGQFVKTTIPQPDNTQFFGAGSVGSGGAWFRNGDTPQFVALHGGGAADLTGDAPQAINPTLPADLLPPPDYRYRRIVGFSGSAVWYGMQIKWRPSDRYRRQTVTNVVMGYDAIKTRWTAPLELDPDSNNDTRTFAAPDGSVYVAHDQDNGAVFRYDPVADSWKPITSRFPAMGNNNGWQPPPHIISVDEHELNVSDGKRLLTFDRLKKTWAETALPAPLQENGQNELWTTAAATTAAVWIGSDRGLWRFDRSRRTWLEMEYPISLDPLPTPKEGAPQTATGEPPLPTGANLEITAVDTHSVWGIAHPYNNDFPLPFRFDRASHQFSVYDHSSGLAINTDDLHLRPDGDSIWITRQSSTYRLNTRRGGFQQVFGVQEQNGPGAPPALPAGVQVGRFSNVAADPVAPDLCYVVISDLAQPLNDHDAQPPFLFRFHKDTGQLDPMPVDAAFLAPDASAPNEESNDHRPPYIHGTGGLFADTDHIWVGTTLGIYWVDRKTGAWSRAKLPEGVTRHIEADEIHADPTGAVWVHDSRITVRIVK